MSNLTNSKLRRMIMQELAKIVGEDALVSKAGKEKDRHITGDLDSNYPFEIDEEEYEQNEYSHLHEGDCGCDCEACDDCSDDGSDYSTDSMLANHPLGDYSNLNKTNITPSQAFSAGYEVSDFDDEVYGLGATSIHIDFPHHGEVHKHKHNNYMAKPALYKVAKYAQKLLRMIPDGYELDDWQRTKIAQISDDISEVYHSLDYDFHDDEY